VIEVDGMAHDLGDRPERDARRDHWLNSQNFRLVRFAAVEVLSDLDCVVAAIMSECGRR
jgi:very-short-patch-repair endonuclease